MEVLKGEIEMKKRNQIIDLIKGIGIFLVVLGHNNTILTNFIYSFHMPLFFIASGLLYKEIKDYRIFVLNKINSILIPYYLFSILLCGFYITIGRNIGKSKIENIPIKESLIGIFYGTNVKNFSYMDWGPLWFMLCLFLVVNIYYFISKKNVYKIITINIILLIINRILALKVNIMLPWSFQTALIAINFFSFGSLLNIEKRIKKNYLYIIIPFTGTLLYIYHNNHTFSMASNRYDNLFVFYLSSITGFFTVLEISKILTKVKWISKILSYLGKNSLIIYAFHFRALTLIKFCAIILKMEFLEGKIYLGILYSIIQILICIPLIYIYNKYALKIKIKGTENNEKPENELCRYI